MRNQVVGIYIFVLRTAAAYAAAFAVIFFATLPTQIEAGNALILPAFGNLLALGIAIAIAVPPISPERLTPKAKRGEWVSLLLPLGLLPFLFVLPSWTAAAGLGFGPELTEAIARLASVPMLALSIIAWLTALLLHFWSTGADDFAEGVVPAE